jgi:uncharacterized protein YecE (DUF72 family)
LPRSLPCDQGRLARFLRALQARPEAHHAIEFRDESWVTPETAACLGSHGVTAVISEAPRWETLTGALVYVRLHGPPHLPLGLRRCGACRLGAADRGMDQ